MLLNSRDIAAFKHVVKSYILPHFKRIFEKELQEDVTEFEGSCSFQTCCEIIYITTFQKEYLKNNSKRMLLNSRDIAAFKHVVKSYILPHYHICLIWVLNLLTFWGKHLFCWLLFVVSLCFYNWSALFLESVLLNLDAEFAYFSWYAFVFYSWSALFLESVLLNLVPEFAYCLG